ncbi:MAG TPA: hypothetical protein VJL10_08030 [Anaerolineales bacterium]|nr:hypothetical protein [Anaerolineales bacterium]
MSLRAGHLLFPMASQPKAWSCARSGTFRCVRAIHRLDKLMKFNQIDYTGGGA